MAGVRRWERVAYAVRCGHCGTTLNVNDMVLYIKLENVKRERIRCEECNGPAPPDLPPLLVTHNTTKAMTPIKKTAATFGGKIWKHG